MPDNFEMYTRHRRQPGQEVPGMSFSDAFREARAAGDKTFKWRGETYSTKTAQEQGREIKAAEGSGRGTYAGRTAANMGTDYNLRTLLGTTAPEDKEDALQRIAGRQPSKSPEQLRDEAKNNTLAALSLMGGLGANVAGRAIANRIAAAASRAPASRAPASRGPLVRDEDLIPDFKKGGKVKAYAKGGSVKGAGCEQRGLRKCKVY